MSMQRIINYGSFLQAYGLKKTIESLGHEVVFVDYHIGKPIAKDVVNSKLNNKIANLFKVVFSKKYRNKRNANIIENQAFSNFNNTFKNKWLPLLGLSREKIYSPNLDALVIGSDEVFNCTQSNTDVGYSLELFGKDNNAKKLLSYAASFGSTTLDKLNRYNKAEEIANCLKQFDAISVRDNNSHLIVKNLVNIEPFDNVDPVIISNFDDEVTPKKIDMKDYVIVYAYCGRINDEEAKTIQEFAHNRGKKTLSIGVRQAFTDEYVCVDPFTMLAYFKNADYVVTDTFHGTVFSIKYQIPFATIFRESNKQKLFDLLKKFDLSHRRLEDLSNIDKVMDSEYDKSKILDNIFNYIDQSVYYLSEYIGN